MQYNAGSVKRYLFIEYLDCILVVLSNYYNIRVLLFIDGGKDRTLEYTNNGAYLNITFQLTNCLYILHI